MSTKMILSCTRCHQRNYVQQRPKKRQTERLQLKKYCKHCNASTLHKETI